MAAPLISICIPAYNGERYLRECLDSCIAQTFRDFELVICDDGSTDRTVAIAEEYARQHTFIRLYKNPANLGLVGNWNRCLELAAGTWIKFLFQDDAMTENCLQRFYEESGKGAELLVCRRDFLLDKETTADEKDYYQNRVRTLENTGHYHSNHFSPATLSTIAAQNISLNFIAEPSLTFFKKELLSKIGVFDADLKQICDLEFFLRVGSNYGLLYIPEQLCRFRIHAHSTTEKNITGRDYRLNYLETLTFALKLLAKPEFQALRKYISAAQQFKLRLYVKYKSYLAFKAMDSGNKALYQAVKEKYKPFFFKKADTMYLKLLALLKSP